MSSPSIQTRPLVGISNPATMLSKVDLPQPDAPTMHTISPSPTSRSIRVIALPTLVDVRFQKWDAILTAPTPPEAQTLARAFDSYARAVALVALEREQCEPGQAPMTVEVRK